MIIKEDFIAYLNMILYKAKLIFSDFQNIEALNYMFFALILVIFFEVIFYFCDEYNSKSK